LLAGPNINAGFPRGGDDATPPANGHGHGLQLPIRFHSVPDTDQVDHGPGTGGSLALVTPGNAVFATDDVPKLVIGNRINLAILSGRVEQGTLGDVPEPPKTRSKLVSYARHTVKPIEITAGIDCRTTVS
jgi:hypothetical protein